MYYFCIVLIMFHLKCITQIRLINIISNTVSIYYYIYIRMLVNIPFYLWSHQVGILDMCNKKYGTFITPNLSICVQQY